jgi:hypothetical protein
MGSEKDLPLGEALLACFRPFIAHLASSSLSRKTIQKHRLRDVIYTDGGPLVHQDSEEAQRSIDSTCRKLHRFFGQPQG